MMPVIDISFEFLAHLRGFPVTFMNGYIVFGDVERILELYKRNIN